MINQKYVVFDKLYAVALFPGISHDAVVVENRKPTSAGFFKVIVEEGKIDVCVFGKSDSLELESNPFDALILKQTLLGAKS